METVTEIQEDDEGGGHEVEESSNGTAPDGPPYFCSRCSATYSTKGNFNKHNKKYHDATLTGKMECPGCPSVFHFHKDLSAHITESHGIELEVEKLSFYSEEDFARWKADEEARTSSFFTKKTVTRTRADVTHYLICNRSGSHPSKATLRNFRNSPSVKTGKTCSAAMTKRVAIHDGLTEISVTYQSTHFGHKMHARRLRLPPECREMIAAKVRAGESLDKILADIRQQRCASNRLSLATKRDIYNVMASFGIRFPQSSNDYTSVQCILDEIQERWPDAVLLYKPHDQLREDQPMLGREDFFLAVMTDSQARILQNCCLNVVYVDSTHGTYKYDFRLTTLMALDYNGEYLPVAMLFSSKISSEIFAVFLGCIRERVGLLSAEVFVSDEAPEYYKAWETVFGPAVKRLVCTWHVSRAWVKQLVRIKDDDARAALKAALDDMHKQLSRHTFSATLERNLADWKASDDTKAFAVYFEKFYSKRPEEWAYCHRKYAADTETVIEGWHAILKCHEEKGGKGMGRIDEAVRITMDATEEKLAGSALCQERFKFASEVQRLGHRHQASKDIPADGVLELENGRTWLVQSGASSAALLDVYKVKLVELECGCDAHCAECDACAHMFRCQCHDSAISRNMCRHIHFICMRSKLPSLIVDHDYHVEGADNHYYYIVESHAIDYGDSGSVVVEDGLAVSSRGLEEDFFKELSEEKTAIMDTWQSLARLVHSTKNRNTAVCILDSLKQLQATASAIEQQQQQQEGGHGD